MTDCLRQSMTACGKVDSRKALWRGFFNRLRYLSCDIFCNENGNVVMQSKNQIQKSKNIKPC